VIIKLDQRSLLKRISASSELSSPPSLTIANRDQLTEITSWHWAIFPEPAVTIRIPGVRDAEARIWEERINRIIMDCGCAMGGAGLFVGIVSCVLVLLAHRVVGFVELSLSLKSAVSVCLGGLFIGKFVASVRKKRALSDAVAAFGSQLVSW
jgi:hypothetical protein